MEPLRELVASWSRKIPTEAIEFLVPLRSFIEESCVLPFPNEFDLADGSITLLGDDDFGHSLELIAIFPAVIVSFAVHEHDDVGILFDRSRLAQMAQFRFVVFGIFRLTI